MFSVLAFAQVCCCCPLSHILGEPLYVSFATFTWESEFEFRSAFASEHMIAVALHALCLTNALRCNVQIQIWSLPDADAISEC